MEHEEHGILQLPLAVISLVDTGRLLREATDLDEFLVQSTLRQPGEKISLPRTSKLLEETAKQNKLNLLVQTERRQLIGFLEELKVNAPVLHFSFAVDPSPAFLRKLTEWLRQEIHPLVLLQIGLQPSIAAGCVLRTTDKYFDFSLRNYLLAKRDTLIGQIAGVSDEMPPSPAQSSGGEQ